MPHRITGEPQLCTPDPEGPVSLGLPVLKKAVQSAGPKLREMNEKARAESDYLRATLTQFKIDLEKGIADKNLWVRK